MQERGELGPEADPDALAYALLAAAQGGYLLTQAHRDARGLQAALGAAIDHIEMLSRRSGPAQALTAPRRPRASR
jgi:hypothetical protein